MFKDSNAFSSFSVTDPSQAKQFYGEPLGLEVTSEMMMGGEYEILTLHLTGGGKVMLYPKPDHQPATFTVLNFEVEDIDAAVEGLTAKGVTFERPDMGEFKPDEKGIYRSSDPKQGPNIAWFKDPAGNVLSLVQ